MTNYTCRCDACARDGQHAPMCDVHLESPEPQPCNCGLLGGVDSSGFDQVIVRAPCET